MADTNPREPNQNRGRLMAIFLVALLFAIGIFQVLSGSSGFVTAEVDEAHLGVCGTYGDTVFVELSTITDVRIVDSFDFGTCVEGKEVGGTVSGIYSCDAYGQYSVHAYTNVPAYIIVTHPEGVLVFNCSSESLTESMYTKLTEAIAKAA